MLSMLFRILKTYFGRIGLLQLLGHNIRVDMQDYQRTSARDHIVIPGRRVVGREIEREEGWQTSEGLVTGLFYALKRTGSVMDPS